MLILALLLMAPAPGEAAAAPVAAPVFTPGSSIASSPAIKATDDPNKVVCHVDQRTGSRLNFNRVCLTVREWDQNQHAQATYMDQQTAVVRH